MKKISLLILALTLFLPLTACGGGSHAVELRVFAAASMTETIDQVVELIS